MPARVFDISEELGFAFVLGLSLQRVFLLGSHTTLPLSKYEVIPRGACSEAQTLAGISASAYLLNAYLAAFLKLST
jgi:hypothetical protein